MQAQGTRQNRPAAITAGEQWVLVGRETEARRLNEAIHKRASLVISGPAGIGKTALVSTVIQRLPPRLAAHCLYIASFYDLQDLLRQLVRSLYARKDPRLRRQLHAEGVSALSLEAWLKRQSSSQLKGSLYRSVEPGDYDVFLDHLPPLTRAVAKVIKELFWMRNTPVYLLVRDEPDEHFDRACDFFYWTENERLTLPPLPVRAAEEVLESCLNLFGLGQFDLSNFREEVLKLSKQNPGTMMQMCMLAADPRYRHESHIKTKSVYIDCLMRGRDLAVHTASATCTMSSTVRVGPTSESA
jgi:hypothetical protein